MTESFMFGEENCGRGVQVTLVAVVPCLYVPCPLTYHTFLYITSTLPFVRTMLVVYLASLYLASCILVFTVPGLTAHCPLLYPVFVAFSYPRPSCTLSFLYPAVLCLVSCVPVPLYLRSSCTLSLIPCLFVPCFLYPILYLIQANPAEPKPNPA